MTRAFAALSQARQQGLEPARDHIDRDGGQDHAHQPDHHRAQRLRHQVADIGGEIEHHSQRQQVAGQNQADRDVIRPAPRRLAGRTG